MPCWVLCYRGFSWLNEVWWWTNSLTYLHLKVLVKSKSTSCLTNPQLQNKFLSCFFDWKAKVQSRRILIIGNFCNLRIDPWMLWTEWLWKRHMTLHVFTLDIPLNFSHESDSTITNVSPFVCSSIRLFVRSTVRPSSKPPSTLILHLSTFILHLSTFSLHLSTFIIHLLTFSLHFATFKLFSLLIILSQLA